MMIMTALIINHRYHVPLTIYMSQCMKHGITYSTVELINDYQHLFACDVSPILTFEIFVICLHSINEFMGIVHTILDIKFCYFHTHERLSL